MEIEWMPEALENYIKTLEYWDRHNASPIYSDKIEQEIILLENEIAENPYFLARYFDELNLYRRSILKGKFFIYYEIREEDKIIEIQHFRSAKQKPLYSNFND